MMKKKQEFMDTWECHDLGKVQEFLQMCIKRKGNKIYLDQAVYLEKVLECFGMQNAKASKVPLIEGYNPSENKGEIDPKICADYQSIIGSLLYLILGTRPDICHAVTKLLQFAANPSQEHLDRAM